MEITIPPGFESDFAETKRLRDQISQNPRSLDKLIQMYTRILERLKPGEYPFFQGVILLNLGLAYKELPAMDRRINLEMAIKCFKDAKNYWPADIVPYEYAMMQYILGIAYRELSRFDRGDSLERAIECYKDSLRFFSLESTASDYATVQNNLGNAYFERLRDNLGANLKHAIQCYHEALRFYTPETTPYEYATIMNSLGNAYLRMPIGDKSKNLTHAINYYQEALRFRTLENSPMEYATTQNSLGAAYLDIPTGDKDHNLEIAIKCFHQALRFITPKTSSLEYGITQANLGAAYLQLSTHDRDSNIQEAIRYFQEALRFNTPEATPLDYARIQNNLGVAYYKLLVGDLQANLNMAIKCFQEALRFRTKDSTPYDYAKTTVNMGLAYLSLWGSDREKNLKQAIKYFQEASQTLTPDTAPHEYAIMQSNLGVAYTNLRSGSVGENLTQAIECFRNALRVLTPDNDPHNYAIVQNNIGLSYLEMPSEDKETNLAHAIVYFQEALRFHKPDASPFDYAIAQNNLGCAYAQLQKGNRDENINQAKKCFLEALRFNTPEINPHECRRSHRHLAYLYFDQKDWSSALLAYQAALDVGEIIYRSGISSESKASEIVENVQLYLHAAFAAACLNDPNRAFLTMERGKTRLLAEALRMRLPRPVGVPDDTWNAFLQAGYALRISQSKNLTLSDMENDPIKIYNMRIQAAQAANSALDAAIDQVRVYAPSFLIGLEQSNIQSLLADGRTALISFCITMAGSKSFVVTQNQDTPVRILDVMNFTLYDLNRLMFISTDKVPNDQVLNDQGNITGGWVGNYLSRDLDLWRSTMDNVLSVIGEKLLSPVLSILSPDIKHLVFLPSGGLFLLPLHAIPLSADGLIRLCDHYQVSYAPSAEVLVDIQANSDIRKGSKLFEVVNPQEDFRLIFTPCEGVSIANLFGESLIEKGQNGTKDRVIEGVKRRAYLHFSCHGIFNWNNPIESGLALADGNLTLADIQNGIMDMSSARLVTLSACETGLIDVLKGSAEEYVGLPGGLMLAGVPCVVSSLWSVPDISTALLMERFYQNHIVEGMDIPLALQEAQLWVRYLDSREVEERIEKCIQGADERNKAQLLAYWKLYHCLAKKDSTCKPFAHPYYWAAFTVNGL